MKTYKLFIFILLIQFTLLSCSDWLDVEPSSEVRLQEQLKSAEGFLEMLNGVYIAVAQRELYGEHLTFGDIEYLAQNHYPNSFGNKGFINYDFADVNSRIRYESYWENIYNTIFNCNLIIDNIDAKADLFNPDDFNILKGEALTMRAFLHFDAIRLFGETYASGTESKKPQVPYVKSADIVRYPHLSTEKVYEALLADLNGADSLLSISDPVFSDYNGYLFNTDERKYHFNYHALNALKARVYLTMGNNEKALEFSTKVIEEAEWSWTTQDMLSNSPVDVLFNNELICALNVINLNTIYDQSFSGPGTGYTTASKEFNSATRIFNTNGDGGNDYRFLYLLGEDKGAFGNAISKKFDQDGLGITGLDFYLHLSVPLFRISEMKLIAAEAALENNRSLAVELLNEVKENREVQLTDYSTSFNNVIMEDIVKEYRKELFLEGQTFFTYKRLNYTKIPDATSIDGFIDLTAADYILPLPEDERELGIID